MCFPLNKQLNEPYNLANNPDSDEQSANQIQNDQGLGQEQCGFAKGTRTRQAIFIIRMISERALLRQMDAHRCFIDYAKAFDETQRKFKH